MARALVLASFVFLTWASPLSGQLAVIVHRDVPVDSLSMDGLREIYAGRVGYWEGGAQRMELILVDHEDRSAADEFSRRVLGLSQARLRLQWLDRILNGEMRRTPVTPGGDAEVARYVAENVGAIGFVRMNAIDPTDERIKVLELDRLAVGEPGYPLPSSGS